MGTAAPVTVEVIFRWHHEVIDVACLPPGACLSIAARLGLPGGLDSVVTFDHRAGCARVTGAVQATVDVKQHEACALTLVPLPLQIEMRSVPALPAPQVPPEIDALWAHTLIAAASAMTVAVAVLLSTPPHFHEEGLDEATVHRLEAALGRTAAVRTRKTSRATDVAAPASSLVDAPGPGSAGAQRKSSPAARRVAPRGSVDDARERAAVLDGVLASLRGPAPGGGGAELHQALAGVQTLRGASVGGGGLFLRGRGTDSRAAEGLYTSDAISVPILGGLGEQASLGVTCDFNCRAAQRDAEFSMQMGVDVGGRLRPIVDLHDDGDVIAEYDRNLIQSVVREHLGQLRYCYSRELQSHPGLAGKVVMKWIITGDGTVSQSAVEATTLHSAPVETCLAAKIRSWRFPPPRSVVIVNYPFVFAQRG